MSTRLIALSLLAIICASSPVFAQTKFDATGGRDRNATLNTLGGFQTTNTQLGGWQGGSWLNNATDQPHDWRLGVKVDNVDTGVLVREVAPNSAGDRARLEVGDIIVAVAGFQVGIIDGRLFELTDELRRQADSSGTVSMLVQDHRSGQLANVRVQLDSGQSSLTGELIYRERIALPADSIVTVQIDNITRPYASVRGGQISFRPTTSGTIPFEIAYDPTYINAADVYQVRGYVTSGGRIIYDTAQSQRVITQGNPAQARINLVAVTANAVVANPTSGTGSSVVTAGYPNYNALDDQIVALYRQYLNRLPTSTELAALRFSPNISTRISSLPIEMMAAQEYFDAAGNNNQLWLQKVFTVILGRTPTQPEFDQWMKRYADLRYSRTELLRQLYSQASARR